MPGGMMEEHDGEEDGEEKKEEKAAKTSMDASSPPVSEDIPLLPTAESTLVAVESPGEDTWQQQPLPDSSRIVNSVVIIIN